MQAHEYAKNEIYDGILNEPFSSGAWRTTALFFAAIVSLVFMGIIGIIIYKNK